MISMEGRIISVGIFNVRATFAYVLLLGTYTSILLFPFDSIIEIAGCYRNIY
jgi:hypothetical protein